MNSYQPIQSQMNRVIPETLSSPNPMRLVLMLYDGSISFLKKAIEFEKCGDIRRKNIYINRGRSIIAELNNALNIAAGGEIASTLRDFYALMDRILMRANLKRGTQGLDDVVLMLSGLRDSWEHAADTILDHQEMDAPTAPIVS